MFFMGSIIFYTLSYISQITCVTLLHKKTLFGLVTSHC